MGKRKNTSGSADGAAKPSKSKRSKADADNNESAAGRPYTVSLAVAASCIENAQNLELATLLAGQIARAAAIFNIDEVVVIDDNPEKMGGRISGAAALFARVLQFMETPQYLRKALIPMHKDLKFAGMLPPLDAPHHLRATEWGPYREGVVTKTTDSGVFLDVGLDKQAFAAQPEIEVGVRVTLKMGSKPKETTVDGVPVLSAEVVHPGEPREEAGLYWGYLTRIAPSLQDMFDGSPFQEGYDLTVGTSERGEVVKSSQLKFPDCKHLLIVIGGPEGLEVCLANDPLKGKYKEASEMFDMWLNTCSKQGSRTIRTEEAILISMAFFEPAIEALNK